MRPQHDALYDTVVHVTPAARAAQAGGAVVFASARAQGLSLELLQPDRALAVPLQDSGALPGRAAPAARSQEPAVSGAASPSVGAGGSALEEAATGRDGTAEASTSGRAAWTALQTHKPNLPEWAAEAACVLWLPVQPGGGPLGMSSLAGEVQKPPTYLPEYHSHPSRPLLPAAPPCSNMQHTCCFCNMCTLQPASFLPVSQLCPAPHSVSCRRIPADAPGGARSSPCHQGPSARRRGRPWWLGRLSPGRLLCRCRRGGGVCAGLPPFPCSAPGGAGVPSLQVGRLWQILSGLHLRLGRVACAWPVAAPA